MRASRLLPAVLISMSSLAQEAPQPQPSPGAEAPKPAAEQSAVPPTAPAAPTEAKPAEAKPAEPAARPAAPALPPPRIPGAAPAAAPKAPDDSGTLVGYTEDETAMLAARIFILDIMASDARSLAMRASFPFYLEDRRFDSEDELFSEWLRNLREKRTDLLTLYGIEILNPQEMEKKYGKPPARLASWPLRSGNTRLAVANISGKAAIALLKLVGNQWKIVAYHD